MSGWIGSKKSGGGKRRGLRNEEGIKVGKKRRKEDESLERDWIKSTRRRSCEDKVTGERKKKEIKKEREGKKKGERLWNMRSWLEGMNMT